MSDEVGAAGAAKRDESFYGHPKGLAVLFFSEMWERFGYYGMRALLILYFAQHFMFPDQVSGGLYGAITSLVYLTPLIGGLIADKYFGQQKSVRLGALLMAAGYFGMFFGGAPAEPYMEYGGTRYQVEIVENGDDSTSQYVVVDSGRYLIEPSSVLDGGVHLGGSDGSILPEDIASGSFRFDAVRSAFYVNITFISLAMVIIGNGYFKPNISTIVGALYAKGDERRDGGFTIFYMGINVGSALTQIISPIVAVVFGWNWGFALAGAGMVAAFFIFSGGRHRFEGHGEVPDPVALAKPKFAGLSTEKLVLLASLLAIPVVWGLLHETHQTAYAALTATQEATGLLGGFLALSLVGKILITVSIIVIIGIPSYTFKYCSREEHHRMIVAILLTMFSVMFWALFEQAGSSLTLYADRNTDRDVFGLFTMPAAQVQVFNPLFIVLLAPFFAMMWTRLAQKGREPSTPVKFSLGLMQLGAGFLVLVYGANFADGNAQVGLIWIAMAYLLHTTGELCISPVGLSMITKLSVARLVGLMMGVWFLSSSFAQYMGGFIAAMASTETVAGTVLDPHAALQTYAEVFTSIGSLSVGVGLLLLVISPLIKKGMHGAG
jgi:proton-dependent oligopeptide transporter, POT family